MTEHTQPGTESVPEGVREAEFIRGFRQGLKHVARELAVWKNGRQGVGVLHEPLSDVYESIDAGERDLDARVCRRLPL